VPILYDRDAIGGGLLMSARDAIAPWVVRDAIVLLTFERDPNGGS